MSTFNPHKPLRPDWWSQRVYELLAALEDHVLPCKGLTSDEQRGVLPIVKNCFAMLWFLGRTGSLGQDEEPRREGHVEMLELVEHNAVGAARKTREAIAQLVDEDYDNEIASSERHMEQNDPGWGPPQARVTEGTVTVRLPGRSGDTVTFSFCVDESGRMQAKGSGPFAELNTLSRLELRAACAAWEELTERISSVANK